MHNRIKDIYALLAALAILAALFLSPQANAAMSEASISLAEQRASLALETGIAGVDELHEASAVRSAA
jgi:hypothetical protein